MTTRSPAKKKKDKTARPRAVGRAGAAAGGPPPDPPLDPLRPGMPAPDSIVGVKEIERGGKTFRIIKTTETDAYDEPARPAPQKRRGRRR